VLQRDQPFAVFGINVICGGSQLAVYIEFTV